jgi:hypothetical protein
VSGGRQAMMGPPARGAGACFEGHGRHGRRRC